MEHVFCDYGESYRIDIEDSLPVGTYVIQDRTANPDTANRYRSHPPRVSPTFHERHIYTYVLLQCHTNLTYTLPTCLSISISIPVSHNSIPHTEHPYLL